MGHMATGNVTPKPPRIVIIGAGFGGLEAAKELSGQPVQVTLVDRYISSEEVGLYFSAADIFAAPYTSGTQSAAVKAALGKK